MLVENFCAVSNSYILIGGYIYSIAGHIRGMEAEKHILGT